jgi:hypothetical protein
MPDLPTRMVNQDVDLLSRDPIQGHLTTSPEGPTSVNVTETLPPHAEVVKATQLADRGRPERAGLHADGHLNGSSTRSSSAGRRMCRCSSNRIRDNEPACRAVSPTSCGYGNTQR